MQGAVVRVLSGNKQTALIMLEDCAAAVSHCNS